MLNISLTKDVLQEYVLRLKQLKLMKSFVKVVQNVLELVQLVQSKALLKTLTTLINQNVLNVRLV